ncbi:MAG: hypothetical protein ABEI13_02505 [Candidatus Paceibacteria bacterium]
MSHLFKEIRIGCLSILLTVSTLLIPQTVNTPQEEAQITFGYPFVFAEMTSAYDAVELSTPNPEEYSSVTYEIWHLKEHPTDFSGRGFVYSSIVFWVATRALFLGIDGVALLRRKL